MACKVFDLACAQGHLFEGWFASQGDFDEQLRQDAVACPACGSVEIRRRPSAPRLNLGAASAEVGRTDPARDAQRVQGQLLRAARELVARSEDVGEAFASEARRIHERRAPARDIRGIATREEVAALVDEGIPVSPLPFGAVTKETLQ